MNRVYKVKFNSNTGRMAVVSELARSRVKSRRTGLALKSVVVLLGLCLGSTAFPWGGEWQSWEGSNYNSLPQKENALSYVMRGYNNDLQYWKSPITPGVTKKVVKGDFNLYGSQNTLKGTLDCLTNNKIPYIFNILGSQNILTPTKSGNIYDNADIGMNVVGFQNKLNSGSSVVGMRNDMSEAKENAFVFGSNNTVAGSNSVVLGLGNQLASGNSVVLGSGVADMNRDSSDNVYIGSGMTFNKGSARHNVTVVGANVKTPTDMQIPEHLTILGAGADASGIAEGKVTTLLGGDTRYESDPSRTAGYDKYDDVEIDTVPYHFQSAPEIGQLVVGKGAERLTRISGVAPGLIAAGSTDAVTGSQVYELMGPIHINPKGVDKTNAVVVNGLDKGILPLVPSHDNDFNVGRNLRASTARVGDVNSLTLEMTPDAVLNTAAFRKDGAYEGAAGVYVSPESVVFRGGETDPEMKVSAAGMAWKDGLRFAQGGKNVILSDAAVRPGQDGVVAVGRDVKVSGSNATAVGTGASAGEGDVALGAGTTVERDKTTYTAGLTSVEGARVTGGTLVLEGFASGGGIEGVASIASKGKTRRLQGVAAGLVSETSTDAVNGSQLYRMAEKMDKLTGWNVSVPGTTEAVTEARVTGENGLHVKGGLNVETALSESDGRPVLEVATKKEAAFKSIALNDEAAPESAAGSVLDKDGLAVKTQDGGMKVSGGGLEAEDVNGKVVMTTRTLEFSGNAGKTGLEADSTGGLVVSGGNIRFNTNAEAVFDVGGRKVTGLGDGEMKTGSTDAVTGGQVFALSESLKSEMKGMTMPVTIVGKGAPSSSFELAAGGRLTLGGDGNLSVDVKKDDKEVSIGLNPDVTVQNSLVVGKGDVKASLMQDGLKLSDSTGEKLSVSAGGVLAEAGSKGLALQDDRVELVNQNGDIHLNAENLRIGQGAEVLESGSSTAGINGLSAQPADGIDFGENGKLAVGGYAAAEATSAAAFGGRRLQGVAAGLVSEASTDAVNGSQLYQVGSSLKQEIDRSAVHYKIKAGDKEIDVDPGLVSLGLKTDKNLTLSATPGAEAALELGLADKVGASEFRAGASSFRENQLAFGEDASIAYDPAGMTMGLRSHDFAFGGASVVSQAGLTTLGSEGASGVVNFNGRRLQNLAEGLVAEGSRDAVTGSQLNELKKPVRIINGSTAVGSNTDESQKLDMVSGASIVLTTDENIKLDISKKHVSDGKTYPNFLSVALKPELTATGITLKKDLADESGLQLSLDDTGDMLMTSTDAAASFGPSGAHLKSTSPKTQTADLVPGELVLDDGTVHTVLGGEKGLVFTQGPTHAAVRMDSKGALRLEAGDVVLGEGTVVAPAGTPSTRLDFDGRSVELGAFAGGNPSGVLALGGRVVQGVAPGAVTADSTDAVNGSQLYRVSEGLLKEVSDNTKPIVVKAGTVQANVPSGETLEFAAGRNLEVSLDQAQRKLTVGTLPEATFDKVTVGEAVLGADGLRWNGGAGVSGEGATLRLSGTHVDMAGASHPLELGMTGRTAGNEELVSAQSILVPKIGGDGTMSMSMPLNAAVQRRPVGVVNAGGRRIQNVAPGLISETSGDVVTGAQIYSLGTSFVKTVNERLRELHLLPDQPAPEHDSSVNVGEGNTSGNGQRNVLFGVNEKVESGTDNVLVGIDNTVVKGDGNHLYGAGNSVQDGAAGNEVFGHNNRIGSGSENSVSGRSNHVEGTGDAVFGNSNHVYGAHSGAFGSSSEVRGDNALALGSNARVGAEGAAVADAVAIGSAAEVLVDKGVAIGAGSVAKGRDDIGAAGLVSFGSEGHERVLSNVAAGVRETDAVNVGQLKKELGGIETQVAESIKSVTLKGSVMSGGQQHSVEGFGFKPGDEIEFAVGENLGLGLEDSGKRVGLTLEKDLKLGSVRTGHAKLDEQGLSLEALADAGAVVLDRTGLSFLKGAAGAALRFVEKDGKVDVLLGTDAVNVAEGGGTANSLGRSDYSTARLDYGDPGRLDVEPGNVAGRTNVAGVVSFGSKDAPRRLMNVAAGLVSKESTDAVNGSQLFETGRALLENTRKAFEVHGLGENKVRIEPGEDAGEPTQVIGRGNTLHGKNLFAVGEGNMNDFPATALGEKHVLVGVKNLTNGNADTMLGRNNQNNGNNNVVVGQNSRVGHLTVDSPEQGGKENARSNMNDSVLVGSNSRIDKPESETSLEGHSVLVGASAELMGLNNTGVGYDVAISGDKGAAFGAGARINGANGTAVGAGASVEAEGGLALGAGASVGMAGGVAIGTGSVVTKRDDLGSAAGVVSFGSKGAERVLSNVAPGVLPTDAVNVSQLDGIKSELSENVKPVTLSDGRNDASVKAGSKLKVTAGDENLVVAVSQGREDEPNTVSVALNRDLAVDSLDFGDDVKLLKQDGKLSTNGKALVVSDTSGAAELARDGLAVRAGNALARLGGGLLKLASGSANVDLDAQGQQLLFRNDGEQGVGLKGKGADLALVVGRHLLIGDGNGAVVENEGETTLGVAGSEGIVNVGGRRIQNLARGLVGENSADAVNGAQLFELGQKLDGELDRAGIGANEISGEDNVVTGRDNKLGGEDGGVSGNTVGGSGNEVVRGDDPADKGADNTVFGKDNKVAGGGNVVVGTGNTADGADSVVIGNGAENTGDDNVVIGHGASASGDKNVALGAGSVAEDRQVDGKTVHVVSVGSADEKRIIANVAAGTEDTDAVNLAQLRERTKGFALTDGKLADPLRINHESTLTVAGDGNVKVKVSGDNSAAKLEIGLASDLKADSLALGSGLLVDAQGIRSVQDGSRHNVLVVPGGSRDILMDDQALTKEGLTAGTAAYGGFRAPGLTELDGFAGGDKVVGRLVVGSADAPRRIQGVAPGLIGEASLDAVNGSQMYAFIKAFDSFKKQASGVRDGKGDVTIGGDADGNHAPKVDGENNTTIGNAQTQVEGDGNTTVGNNNQVTGDGNFVGGKDNVVKAGEDGSNVVTGNGNKVDGSSNTVSGGNNTVNGTENQVVGTGNVVGGDDGTPVTGNQVMGNNTEVRGDDNVVIGNGAVSKGADNVVLGHSASAEGDGNVALGAGSKAADRTVDGKTVHVVSVGSADEQRIIANVAAGTADTDAVNVGQLKDLSTKIEEKVRPVRFEDGNGNAGDLKAGSTVTWRGDENVSVTLTPDDKGGAKSVNVALNSKVSVDELTLNGSAGVESASLKVGKDSLNVGAGNITLGKNAVVTAAGAATAGDSTLTDFKLELDLGEDGKKTVDLGQFAGADAVGVVSLGNEDEARRIQNLAAGLISATSTDAVNGSQLYAVVKAVSQLEGVRSDAGGNINIGGETEGGEGSKNTTAVGTGSQARGDGSTAVGAGASAKDGGTAVGSDAKAEGANNVAIGKGSVATQRDDLAPGVVGVVSVGNEEKGETRIISGVADGTRPTDAVNLRQLEGVNNRLNHRIDSVRKEARSGIATAVAMANLPTIQQAGRSTVSVGVGNFKDVGAMAFGASHLTEDGKTLFKVSGSFSTEGDTTVGAGVGFLW